MSMRFSICTKILVVVLIFTMLSCSLVYGHGDHSGSDPCWKERDDRNDEVRLLGIYGAAAAGACLPASVATIVGAVACAAAIAVYCHQIGEVEEADRALAACERNHDQN